MNAKIKDFFNVDAVEKAAGAMAKELRKFNSVQIILIKTAHFFKIAGLKTIATDYLFFADKSGFSQYEKANPQRFKDFGDLRDFLQTLLTFERECAFYMQGADFKENEACEAAAIAYCKDKNGAAQIKTLAVFGCSKNIAGFIECVLFGGKEFESAALIENLQKRLNKTFDKIHADFDKGIQDEKADFEKIILDAVFD